MINFVLLVSLFYQEVQNYVEYHNFITLKDEIFNGSF